MYTHLPPPLPPAPPLSQHHPFQNGPLNVLHSPPHPSPPNSHSHVIFPDLTQPEVGQESNSCVIPSSNSDTSTQVNYSTSRHSFSLRRSSLCSQPDISCVRITRGQAAHSGARTCLSRSLPSHTSSPITEQQIITRHYSL